MSAKTAKRDTAPTPAQTTPAAPAAKKPAVLEPDVVTGRFVTTLRHSHLLYESVEITVKDGIVVAVKMLSRAPDMAAVAIGHASSKLWEISRDR